MVQDNPLISVLVTSYNHERYIGTCVDSLVNQTYRHLDIHVVDDCSNDGSADILRSYGDRIRLTVREENRGIEGFCPTLNEAIRAATGEFFYRLDSDDFIEPDYLERMIREVIANPRLDWVCGGLNVVDAEGRVQDTWEYTSWPTDPDLALARGWQTCSVIVPHNGIFRTSFLRDHDLYFENFPYGWGADVLFTIRAVQCRPGIKLISGPGFNWRTHGGNHSCDIARRIELVLAVKEYYASNISETLFLRHPWMGRYSRGSDDYEATKFFLVAADLHRAKASFRVPEMFVTETTGEEIEANLWRFDRAIRRYADRSLDYSPRYEKEIKILLGRLEADKAVVEGRRCIKLGDFRQASAQFQRALQSDPQSVAALRGLGEICYGQGDLPGAQRYSSQALQLAPDDTRTLNNAGVVLFSCGDYARSEQAFTKAVAIDPGYADAHTNLLELYGTLCLKTAVDSRRREAILRSAHWVSEYAPGGSRIPLMQENHRLRDKTLREYSDRYAGTEARILLHRPCNGALRYLMDSWAETLNFMGLATALLDWGENTRRKLDHFRPSAFITVTDPAYMQQLDIDCLKRYRRDRGLKVGHITTLHHCYDPCDFIVTFHLDPSRDPALGALDLPLVSLPFGINPLQHYMRPGREIWDFFFVGTNSHLKIRETDDYLRPIIDEYRGILAGVNWPVGIGELPVQESALLYNFAKVYPNYHLQAQFDAFNELNERTYIIPACGGFELVDSPQAMKELFAADEMVVAGSPAEFHDMFAHFLEHPEEREPYIRKGMRRVWREYTLFHVLCRLADFLGATRRRKVTATAVEQST